MGSMRGANHSHTETDRPVSEVSTAKRQRVTEDVTNSRSSTDQCMDKDDAGLASLDVLAQESKASRDSLSTNCLSMAIAILQKKGGEDRFYRFVQY